MYIFLLIILFWKYHFCELSKESTVSFKSNFPIYEEENFIIEISSSYYKIPLYSFIILRCKKNEILNEEHILNPGYLKGLPKRLHGDFFTVLNYNIKSNLIVITLNFKRAAVDSQFEVIFKETNLKEERMNIIENITMQSQYIIKIFNISLLLHWKLELIQKTLDHRENGLFENSINILKCKASGGFPFSPVKFIGLNKLSGTLHEISKSENEIEFRFHTKLSDHNKKVGCWAGNDVIYDSIRIFHHPKEVELIPPVSEYVRNGSSIICKVKDGYPSPNIKWFFHSGPENSEKYFTIDRNILNLHKDAPLGSKWVFNCTSINSIPNSPHQGKIETVSFMIGDPPFSKILIVCLAVAAAIFIISLALIVHLCLKRSKLKNDKCQSFSHTLLTKKALENEIENDKNVLFI